MNLEHLTPEGFQFAYDNTSLSTFKDCPRKYKLSILEGYRAHGIAPPLFFGNFLHKAMEFWPRATGSHDEKMQALVRWLFLEIKAQFPEDSNLGQRTFPNLVRTLIWYFDDFKNSNIVTKLDYKNEPLTELSFRVEFPASYSSAPNGVLYCGHFDQIVTYADKDYVMDHKHTTWAMDDKYLARFNPNAQFTGYIWGAQIGLNVPVYGAIVNMIQIGANFSRFRRGIEVRTEEQLQEWVASTAMWISFIEQAWLHNYFPMNEESCTKYGGCVFRKVCSLDRRMHQVYLSSDFQVNHWRPLANRDE